MTELKFFRVVISDNRNYAYITASDYVHFFGRSFDKIETSILQNWFNCTQAVEHNVILHIADNSKSCTLLLREPSLQRHLETYWSPALLQKRVDTLLKIESELFDKIEGILEPRF